MSADRMGRPEHSTLSVGGMVWGVAFAGLQIAAWSIPADARGVTSLAITGHLIWGASWLAGSRDDGRAERRSGSLLVVAVLCVFGIVELAGLGVARMEAQRDQALWFALAASFAAAGVAAAFRRGPRDASLASQLFFHVLMIVPALAIAVNVGMSWFGGRGIQGVLTGPAALARMLVLVAVVIVPALFAAIVFTIAHEALRPAEDREFVWPALLAHQAAYVVIVSRWAADGL